MSKNRAKPKKGKDKQASARAARQVIVTHAPPAKAASRRKQQPARLAQQSLVENSLYKLEDLAGVKEEWSDRLLLPGISRAARPTSTAVSFKPTDNVVAIGIGEKFVAGKPTGVLALKFLVRSKKERNLVLSKHLLPTSVRGLPVDVEQVGTFRASNTEPNPRVEMRPARPGCSVGFRPPTGGFAEVGTFGALVKRGNSLFILSNNHVLADENNLQPGAPIFQPAILDDTNFGNHQIARLFSFAALLHGAPNRIDCAIAEVTNPSLVSNSILHIGAPSGTTAPSIGMPVHKFGRTSGYSVGSISMIGTDARLQYDTDIFLFKNQMIIRSSTNHNFSEKGDSGALVVQRVTQRAVGLLIGRASDGTSGVATPINEVLQALNVTLA
ncbi:MAG TPA: hypothetical protein VE842_10375 [Pyrinomonadaceae bacterium]|nr:hypothetical protein [Pyrinomonadaceae bacterium]